MEKGEGRQCQCQRGKVCLLSCMLARAGSMHACVVGQPVSNSPAACMHAFPRAGRIHVSTFVFYIEQDKMIERGNVIVR